MTFLDQMSPREVAAMAQPAFDENEFLRGKLEEVYRWLVDELGFPFDMFTAQKPPWLDVRRLAAEWRDRDGRERPGVESVDDYEHCIYYETGWAREGAGS